jgi:3-phenylpropionate/trans-cinnamate dioxygenase ferredoxin reductase subunit
LVVATGTRARHLPHLSGMSGVHHLRTAADAGAIDAALARRSAITIVGGGFIGLEIASVARQRDCEVTVVEVAERPLAPVLGETLSAWLQDWHAARRVDFRCSATVDEATALGGEVELSLSDGTTLRSGVVVVGVGVHRELEWLQSSGIDTHVGLRCDPDGRTSVPGVFGAGDVVCVHEPSGTCRPGQHWTAAVESARRVARTVLGLPPEDSAREDYFWSNQGHLRLASVGHRTPTSHLVMAAGALADDRFVAHWVEQDGRVVGVVGANSAQDFLRGRVAFRRDAQMLIAQGA